MKKWILSLVAISAFSAVADEGMWQPHQLPELSDKLITMGLEIDAKSISKLTEFPMNAVISLGGCSASFVSPKGLVVTNHHCAYGTIQYNSTAENNLLNNGFLAKNYSEELPATPGSRVYVTEQMVDVTDKIKANLSNKKAKDYYDAIEQNQKQLVAECEQNQDYRCQVYSFHRGLEYYLIKQLEIKDVRLTYAPTLSIGKYGGDIDNWMWPRHTGDFAFYRAYVGPDGKPAEFNKDNVPYEPKSFLNLSAKGVQDGDFVMVAGYPGHTNRYRTIDEVENQFQWYYPKAKALRENFIEIIKNTTTEGSDDRIKYEGLLANLANYAKNFASMIESYDNSNMLNKKRQQDAELTQWLASSSRLHQQYSEPLKALDELIKQKQSMQERDLVLSYLNFTTMLPTANKLYRLANEKQRDDMQREPGYQQRDMARFKAAMERIDRRYASKVDKALLLEMITRYANLPQAQRLPELDKAFAISSPLNTTKLKQIIDKLYGDTKLNDQATRLAWMEKDANDFKNSKDPFIQLAVALYDMNIRLEQEEKALSGKLMQARPQYMAAIIAYNQAQNKPIYADANSSLRVSVGHVKGYSPKDGLYGQPFTRLQGILQKDTGITPFDSPKKQLALINNKQYGDYYMAQIDSVPVNFLSTLDVTGGNSGSPILNGKAELVGLLFDGVYESIIGDWHYDDNLNRAIQVDSRYMLWIMEYLDNADNLLTEMEIVK